MSKKKGNARVRRCGENRGSGKRSEGRAINVGMGCHKVHRTTTEPLGAKYVQANRTMWVVIVITHGTIKYRHEELQKYKGIRQAVGWAANNVKLVVINAHACPCMSIMVEGNKW